MIRTWEWWRVQVLPRRTVLVLGAGASKPRGYPLGKDLRDRVFALGTPSRLEFAKKAGLAANASELERFVTAFRMSQISSIDAFLARRPEFGPIGKRAIAALLLECEDLAGLTDCTAKDDWYPYFFNSLAPESWRSLDFSKLAILTFNYDRFLEHYLLTALQHAYEIDQAAVVAKLRQLEIIHIHGSLGPTLPDEVGYIAYGDGVDEDRVARAAECIRVIPEGRDSDPHLDRARNLLSSAEAIVFLGFGFDRANLRRLNAAVTCAGNVAKNGEIAARRVVGTCFGKTIEEANAAARDTHGSHYFGEQPPRDPNGYFRTDCITLLRETLILTD